MDQALSPLYTVWLSLRLWDDTYGICIASKIKWNQNNASKRIDFAVNGYDWLKSYIKIEGRGIFILCLYSYLTFFTILEYSTNVFDPRVPRLLECKSAELHPFMITFYDRARYPLVHDWNPNLSRLTRGGRILWPSCILQWIDGVVFKVQNEVPISCLSSYSVV